MQDIKDKIHFKYNSVAGVIKFYNGSEILLKDLFAYPSDPNFDELGSLELTDAFIDESNQVIKKAKDIVRSRIRYKLDEFDLIPKILMSCNPAKNWVYTDFYQPSVKNTLPQGRRFIQSLVTDNPYIPQSYIDTLHELDYTTKQRLLFGNWDYDDDPSALCQYDAIVSMFTNDHVQPSSKNYISADLAMQGRDRFIAGHWEGLVGHVDIDKEKATGRSIELALRDLKNEHRVMNTDIVADADGLGNYLESYIENIKSFHGNARPSDDQYANLKSECAFKLAELINRGEIRIICSEDQKQRIINEVSICLKRHKIDADDQKKRIIPKEKMKEFLGHSPDYLDFLIMRMFFEVKEEFNVYL